MEQDQVSQNIDRFYVRILNLFACFFLLSCINSLSITSYQIT